MNYWGIDTSEEIEHYGVKGMKWRHRRWGIRRNGGARKLPMVSENEGKGKQRGLSYYNGATGEYYTNKLPKNRSIRSTYTDYLQQRPNYRKGAKPDEGDRNFRSGKQGHAQDYGREYWNLVRADDSEKRRKKKG